MNDMMQTMTKKATQPLKGFRDFFPQEAIKRQWLAKKLQQIFEIWGYDPLETPTLEPLEVFKGEVGEGETMFYQFKDLGGRQVALRYDQTAPTCRVLGRYFGKIALPFRRYQIQPVFRAEKPQKGRYREFVQCDADIYGVKSPYADAETIALSLDIYRQLGFKTAKALINNRSLIKDIPYSALVAIDKLKKIGQKGVIQEMGAKGISKEKAQQYLNQIKEIKPDETIKIILDYLKKMGFPESWYQFEPTVVRSFAYSSGPIWEVFIPGYSAGSVIGGERYDNLAKNITGVNIPATGFGLGFDRTLEAAEKFNLVPKIVTKTHLLVTVFSSDYLTKSITLAKKLRAAAINTELYPDPETKLDKQLKYADRKGIPFVIIMGPDEIKKNMITLRDMKAKKQQLLTLSQAMKKLS